MQYPNLSICATVWTTLTYLAHAFLKHEVASGCCNFVTRSSFQQPPATIEPVMKLKQNYNNPFYVINNRLKHFKPSGLRPRPVGTDIMQFPKQNSNASVTKIHPTDPLLRGIRLSIIFDIELSLFSHFRSSLVTTI